MSAIARGYCRHCASLLRDASAAWCDVDCEIAGFTAQRDDLLAALVELRALVKGECPRLLNEDSGGDARLNVAIDAAIARAKGTT